MKAIYRQIEDYIFYCENVRKMSPTTIRAKKYILNDFIKETSIKNIKSLSNQTFNTYVAKKSQSDISGRSLNAYMTAVVAFAKYYRELGLVTSFRPVLVKKFKERKVERKFYTPEQVKTVLRVADSETGLMIRIMFETGMRIAEVTKLRLSDFDGCKICFIGKGSKMREVYIRNETKSEIEKYIKMNGVKDFLWGATLNGEPPTASTIRRKMQAAFLEAGFPGFYPHALRHSFATNLQIKGASAAEIKEMMGHSSIATTERYLHGFNGKMKELFNKYGA